MNRLPFNPLLAGNPMNQARFAGPFPGAGPNLAAFNNRAGILGEYIQPMSAFQVQNAIAGRLNHPGANNFHMVGGMPLLDHGFNQQQGLGDFNQLGSDAGFQQSADGRAYDQPFNRSENEDDGQPFNRSENEDDGQSYDDEADNGRGYGNQSRNDRGYSDRDYGNYDDNERGYNDDRRRPDEEGGTYEMPSTNFQDYMDNNQANGREQKSRDREKRGERRERRSRWEDVDSPRSERRDQAGRDADRRGGGRDRRESRRDDRHDDDRDRRDKDRDRDRRDSRGRRDDRDRQRDRRDEGRGDTSFSNEDNDSQDSSHSSGMRDRERDYRDSERSSRGRDRDNDRDDRDRGRGRDWQSDRPSDTILLRSLPMFVNEAHIQTALMSFDGTAKDVRHMKRRETGASRGFAFVEFHNVQDAQRWMEQNKGQLYIEGQRVFMHYSHSRERNMELGGPGGGADPRYDPNKGDWICSKCGAHNFKRREFCFKCNISREESEKADVDDGSDQLGTNPCNTLLFRGLDALTTEDSLQSRLTALAGTAPKNILVIRDPLTNVSKSFAFVELDSVMASAKLLEMLTAKNTPFELDGKLILVDYAKNTYSTVMASLNAANYQDYAQYYNQSYDGYYDQSQYYDYSNYYSGHDITQQAPPADPKAANQADSTNAAAAVAQAAMKQVKAVKDFHKQVHGQQQQQQQQHTVVSVDQYPSQQPPPPGTSSSTDEYLKYPMPDVSTYQYDESSGYYYDPQTTLYYDANSQYYYNATTGQFMYWDGERSTYLPAPTNGEGGSSETTETADKPGEHKDKKEKVKMAKKIAKDMEKWAKSMNAQKESVKDRERRLSQMTTTKKESATADCGFSILEKAKTDAKLMPPPPGPFAAAAKVASPPNSALVGDYGGDDSDEEEEPDGGWSSDTGVIDENKYLDWDKNACLLCKRQFPSMDALQRHQQLSDLHKQNMANLYKARSSAQVETLQTGSQYRDRAKERRKKYGTAAPPEPKRGRMPAPPIPHEEPNKGGIAQDNRGNKLLQKMGWSEGSGLGAKRQGIVDPIMAQRRQAGAGLGAKGSSYGVAAGDTYKDTVKKMMVARFQDFDS